MTLSPGVRLGPYEIVAPLGSGGMGEVYRATEPRLRRDVAIKVLPSGLATDPERLRRFEQEALAAASLNHPNILAVHDIGIHDDAPYIVSELLEGSTLRQTLASGAFPLRKALDYGMQIAAGLGAAHEQGIVHRDLKPENLFVTRDGRVKILDFGVAKLTQAEPAAAAATNLLTGVPGTEPGLIVGTVGYMAPEQVRGETVGHRADIFSFALVLYEMLAGRRAFAAPSAIETMNAILRNLLQGSGSCSRSGSSISIERAKCYRRDGGRCAGWRGRLVATRSGLRDRERWRARAPCSRSRRPDDLARSSRCPAT